MNRKLFLVLLIISLALSACARVTDRVMEQATGRIVEQVTGLENVQINQDGEVVSFSAEADGVRYDFAGTSDASAEAFTAMGFTIPLPAGLSVVSSSQVDQDGQDMLANTSYDLVDIDEVALRTAVTASLIEAGFLYLAFLSADSEPDMNSPMLNFVHPDGYQFMLIVDGGSALLSLTRTTPESVTNMLPKEVITEFDGQMSPDKTSYTAGEEIRLTFISNTNLDDWAWVGIVPPDTPRGEDAGNAAYLVFAYVSYVENGILTLHAPMDPGEYDMRLYNAGLELASVPIRVTE